MSTSVSSIGRTIGILVIAAVMAGVIWNVGGKLRDGEAHASGHGNTGMDLQGINHGSPLDRIRAESAMYHSPEVSTGQADTERSDVQTRNLAEYYNRRAYLGAPPKVAHPVDPEAARAQDCLVCHEKGGFAPVYNAYTPVTPHADYINCMQCHVSQNATDLFRENEWASLNEPDLHRPMLPGGPPPIPHSLQLRGSCLSCHAGPSAPIEIRTTHPERINCRQCHVPSNSGMEYTRQVAQAAPAEATP